MPSPRTTSTWLSRRRRYSSLLIGACCHAWRPPLRVGLLDQKRCRVPSAHLALQARRFAVAQGYQAAVADGASDALWTRPGLRMGLDG